LLSGQEFIFQKQRIDIRRQIFSNQCNPALPGEQAITGGVCYFFIKQPSCAARLSRHLAALALLGLAQPQ